MLPAVPSKPDVPRSLAELHAAMLAEAGITVQVLTKAGVRLSEALDAMQHTRQGEVPDWRIRLDAVRQIALLLGAHAPQRLEHVGEPRRGLAAGPMIVVNVPDWLRPPADVIEIKEIK